MYGRNYRGDDRVKKIFILYLCLFIFTIDGCKQIEKNEETTMNSNTKIKTSWDDFQLADTSDLVFDLRDVRKIYFEYVNGYSNDLLFRVGIDLQKRELYYNSSLAGIDDEEPSCVLEKEDIDELIKILQDEKVLNWKEFYGYKAENLVDEYGWSLCMETPD